MSSLYVFGYGSLIFAPELPERVVARIPARLPGYRRAFNKRSKDRGCAPDASYAAFPGLLRGYLISGHVHSLVLGTESVEGQAESGLDARESMVGVLLEYPGACRVELLARLDAREGFDSRRLSRENGYLRRELAVFPTRGGAPLRAVTYLTNPDPDNRYAVPAHFDLTTRAKILINATPIRPPERPGRESGLRYFEGVRRNLGEIGVVDPHLEALAAIIWDLGEPWRQLIRPPRPAADQAGLR